MGGDGGVIATKRAFSRGVGKNSGRDGKREGRNATEEQNTRARTCALSNEKLTVPIVCCEMGNVYNKERILTALLEQTMPESLSHIRGLKDLKTLRLTDNPRSLADVPTVSDDAAPLFICPVTKEEFNGVYPFVAIWSTGWVLSDKAIKEMGTEALQEEYGPFSALDIVKLLPQEHEMDAQRAAMHRRREQQPAKKKKEKKDKGGSKREGREDEAADDYATKKRKSEDKKASNGLAKLSAAESLVSTASSSLKEMENKSEVFKTLFHKQGEKDKKDRDLFMTVAGIRYTL